MKTGKASESVWKRSVGKQLPDKKQNILIGAGIGNDCTAFCVNEASAVLASIEPIAIPSRDAADRAVHAALNAIAAQGAEPTGILASLLLPAETQESELKQLVKGIAEAAEAAGTTVLEAKVHTVSAVNTPVLTVSALGTAAIDTVKALQKDAPEQDVVCTKWIGLDATATLAVEKEEELLAKLPKDFIKKAQAYRELRSILPEAAAAGKSGAAAMYPAGEGGIFAALWELGERAGVGLEIDLKKIPVKQETIEICEILELNPYELASAGCLLLLTPDGFGLVRRLAEAGIAAAVIGKTTAGNDRVLYNGEETRYLEPAKPDELYRVLS